MGLLGCWVAKLSSPTGIGLAATRMDQPSGRTDVGGGSLEQPQPLAQPRTLYLSRLEALSYKRAVPAARRWLTSTKERTMNLIIWLVVGGLIGWVASMIMKTDAQQGIVLNVIVGIVGSLLGGWLVGPLLGAGTINQNDFSIRGLLASLIGAVILLAIVNLARRGHVR
jgi:uncharacterized membrane protein YeaQ/YmgE (transglycosylase-associated protein family)